MYNKLLQLLLSSSLSSLISEHEIEEIAIELEDEIQEIINEKIEEINDEAEENKKIEISKLTSKINYLENQLQDIQKYLPNLDSLSDIMTMEWIIQNWEYIVKFQQMNIEGKKLLNYIKQNFSKKD